MTLRVYLVPIINVTNSRGLSLRSPKYFAIGGGAQTALSGLEGLDIEGCSDFGLHPIMLVVADVTIAQHTILAAQGDITTLPANIDSNITSGALTTVQNSLETLNIPGDWVTTSNTYRQVLRYVLALFQFTGLLSANTGLDLFANSVTLTTTYGQLSAIVQSGIISTAQQLNLSTSGLNNSTTIKQILRAIVTQMPSFDIGGISL